MSQLDRNALVDSPCVGICSATALGDEVCIGCKRTFDEIINWNTLSDAQKRCINERIKNEM